MTEAITPKCAICHKRPVTLEYKPFCSRRCSDVDLGRWLKGAYAIPDNTPLDAGGEEESGLPADDELD